MVILLRDTHKKVNKNLDLSALVGMVTRLLPQKLSLINLFLKKFKLFLTEAKKKKKRQNKSSFFSTRDIHKLKVTIGVIKNMKSMKNA